MGAIFDEREYIHKNNIYLPNLGGSSVAPNYEGIFWYPRPPAP